MVVNNMPWPDKRLVKFREAPHLVAQLYGAPPHGMYESLTLFYTKMSFKIRNDTTTS
jgi:hypothetical protein